MINFTVKKQGKAWHWSLQEYGKILAEGYRRTKIDATEAADDWLRLNRSIVSSPATVQVSPASSTFDDDVGLPWSTDLRGAGVYSSATVYTNDSSTVCSIKGLCSAQKANAIVEAVNAYQALTAKISKLENGLRVARVLQHKLAHDLKRSKLPTPKTDSFVGWGVGGLEVVPASCARSLERRLEVMEAVYSETVCALFPKE